MLQLFSTKDYVLNIILGKNAKQPLNHFSLIY